jgi:hypothetical protein
MTERAFEARMRAALFDAAETDLVTLGDSGLVLEVGNEVVVLGRAGLPEAHGVMGLDVVGVRFAEGATAVLARVGGGVNAT